jgi:hypothetical protein
MEIQRFNKASSPPLAATSPGGCFTSTSYLSSISDYKRVFSQLDTTSLIPSLNFFLTKPDENNSNAPPPPLPVDKTDLTSLKNKMSVHFSQLESFSFCAAQKNSQPSRTAHRETLSPVTVLNQTMSERVSVKSEHKQRRRVRSNLSASEPNLFTALSEEANACPNRGDRSETQNGIDQRNRLFHTALNEKLAKIRNSRKKRSHKNDDSEENREVRGFKLKDKFKFQFKTNSAFCGVFKQFVTCSGANKNAMLDGTSLSRNSKNSRSKARSKSLSHIIVDDSRLRSRQSVNKSFSRYKNERLILEDLNNERENIVVQKKPTETNLTVPHYDLNAIEPLSQSKALEQEPATPSKIINQENASPINSSKFERFLKLTHMHLRTKSLNYSHRRRHLSDTNLQIAGGKDPRGASRNPFNEQDEKMLREFLSRKRVCSRRNAICSRIDKLEQNKQLLNYMEFLLREDYIKNFLL